MATSLSGPPRREGLRPSAAGQLIDCVLPERGARWLPPLHWDGVKVLILDESSQMLTGSFKALTAAECVTDCVRRGIEEICFCSGANTGTALAAYAGRTGIKTHFFLPATNTWKLDRRYVGGALSRVYAVSDAAEVKEVCREFSTRTGIPQMPERQHHHQAGLRRGSLIASVIKDGLDCDWFAQTVCAGFGPIGIYNLLLSERSRTPGFRVPRFLAVQQSGNCALAKHLCAKDAGPGSARCEPSDALIEPTMFDHHPETYGTFADMEDLLDRSGGTVVTITPTAFMGALGGLGEGPRVLGFLEQNGVTLGCTTHGGKTEFLDKAGLLALAGVANSIGRGLIASGQTVICSFSGGATVGGFEPLPAERVISVDHPFSASLAAIVASARKDAVSA